MEIWRARERYYIGLPMERLLIFLLFMALCVGLGLLIGGCQDFDRAVARMHGITIDPFPGPCAQEESIKAGHCVPPKPQGAMHEADTVHR